MPWTQTDAVLERQKFVKAVLSGRWTMTETCRRFGISRQTGVEVMARHAERGLGWARRRVARSVRRRGVRR